MTKNSLETAFRDIRFWDIVAPCADEMAAKTQPYILEALSGDRLLRKLAGTLLDGIEVKPTLMDQCLRNLARRFVLPDRDVEWALDAQMRSQLEAYHVEQDQFASIVEYSYGDEF